MPKGVSFDVPTRRRTPLELLKNSDELETIANKFIDSIPLAGFHTEHRIRLKEFFNLTVQLSPENRASDVGNLVGLLSQEL
jgi:hypothetical protein